MIGKMKTLFSRILPVLFICASATFSRAGDFQSAVITSVTFPTGLTIIVPDDNFLVVRNFTQVSPGATNRGVVTVVNLNGQKGVNADILTAAIINSSTMISPEVINNVIVGGSAKVSVTCPDAAATCFISYRVGED
jgi:hypothetical protein